MSQTDHECLTTKYLGDVQGQPRILYLAKCRYPECQFREDTLTPEDRDTAVSRHRRSEAKKTIYAGLSNVVKNDPKMLAQALARFASIATHEYEEWVEVVRKLMKDQFHMDLEFIETDHMRTYYDSGTDALTTVGKLVNQHRVPVAYK